MKIAFLGLGKMGLPMAANLLRAGHMLTVFNRSMNRSDTLDGARRALTPGEAVAGAELVVTMLSDDEAVEQVVLAPQTGFLAAMPRGAVHVSSSTISVAMARRLTDAHRAAGQAYVSAPVFGRPEAAAAAKLWVVAAGAAEHVARCRAVFDAVGQGFFVVGPDPATANLVKLAGNFMIAAMLETFGEAFALVGGAGVTAATFLEVVNTALFKSPLYQNYGTLAAEQRFEPAGFRLKLGLKDVRLAIEAARAGNLQLPLADLVRDHFEQAIARGLGDQDWAAVTKVAAGEDRGARKAGSAQERQ